MGMPFVVLMMLPLTAHATPPAPLIQALSARHGIESCEALEVYSASLEADLRRVVEEVSLPPWAPMNAAICLIEEHPMSAQSLLRSWVQSPDQRGLARLVFRRIQTLPEEVAIDVMQHALDGPHRDEALVATQTDTRTRVRSLRPSAPSGL